MNNIDNSYIKILEDLKIKIKNAQVRAILSVNSEVIILYWNIGNTILKQQKEQG